MSVHFKPLIIPEQDGSLQDLLHWQDNTSRTACGAGWPPIQSITSFPASVHQPDPTGDGMSGHLCKLRLHTGAWSLAGSECSRSVSLQGGNWSWLDSTSPLQTEQPVSQLILMPLVPGVLQYMAHVNFWRLWCRSSDKFYSIPSCWNISWNSTFRVAIRYPTTFPRPAKALTVSQPENAWKPGSDLHTIAPTLSTILETSMYLTLVCEPHLMNTAQGRNKTFASQKKYQNISVFWYYDDWSKPLSSCMEWV